MKGPIFPAIRGRTARLIASASQGTAHRNKARWGDDPIRNLWSALPTSILRFLGSSSGPRRWSTSTSEILGGANTP
jgi:hypothetical protein